MVQGRRACSSLRVTHGQRPCPVVCGLPFLQGKRAVYLQLGTPGVAGRAWSRARGEDRSPGCWRGQGTPKANATHPGVLPTDSECRWSLCRKSSAWPSIRPLCRGQQGWAEQAAFTSMRRVPTSGFNSSSSNWLISKTT